MAKKTIDTLRTEAATANEKAQKARKEADAAQGTDAHAKLQEAAEALAAEAKAADLLVSKAEADATEATEKAAKKAQDKDVREQLATMADELKATAAAHGYKVLYLRKPDGHASWSKRRAKTWPDGYETVNVDKL